MLKQSFQKELDKLAKLNSKYKKQLKFVENKIKKEFGFYPSEVDCDSFIDSYHTGCGNLSIEQLNEDMNLKTLGE